MEEPTPSGPRTLGDCCMWPKEFLQRITSGEHRREVAANLQSRQKLLVTTSFAGIGTAEIAAAMICRELQTSGHWPADRTCLEVYCSCEIDKACVSVLQAMEGFPCKSQHLFGDVSNVAAPELVTSLAKDLQSLRRQVQAKQQSTTYKSYKAELAKACRNWCRKAASILDSAELSDAMYCRGCQKQCRRFPGTRERANAVWLEIAGSPCVPFCKGAYGTGLSWLHPVSVPVFIWLHSLKRAQPDMILHENVPDFTPLVFDLVLNAEEQCYSVESVVWSPSAHGLPISRDRRYTLCRRLASFTRKLDFNYDALQQYFFASQVADAHIFFQASADMSRHVERAEQRPCHQARAAANANHETRRTFSLALASAHDLL
ncbi:unnamed protein product [Effrenium voratum]|nr:unnamed protein product [Effrenium voratum]